MMLFVGLLLIAFVIGIKVGLWIAPTEEKERDEARRLAEEIRGQLVRVVKASKVGDRITVPVFVLPWEGEK